jgi:hypothetical protein
MSTTFFGYHGTKGVYARQIVSSGYFKPSLDENDWLGSGVYFFEDDIKQAYYYCIKAKKYTSWAILWARIEADNVIDLTKLDHFEEFQKIAKKIKDRYLKTKEGKPRKLINSVVLDMMYKLKPYDVVRCHFEVPSGFVVDRTNVKAMQTQLCVRNANCIKEFKEVPYDGH